MEKTITIYILLYFKVELNYKIILIFIYTQFFNYFFKLKILFNIYIYIFINEFIGK